MSANLGTPLPSPPEDGISNLRFSLSSDLLLAPSWDGVCHSFPFRFRGSINLLTVATRAFVGECLR